MFHVFIFPKASGKQSQVPTNYDHEALFTDADIHSWVEPKVQLVLFETPNLTYMCLAPIMAKPLILKKVCICIHIISMQIRFQFAHFYVLYNYDLTIYFILLGRL